MRREGEAAGIDLVVVINPSAPTWKASTRSDGATPPGNS